MVAKLTLVGNLGVEPEVRYTADGKPVVTCRVASNYRKKDADSRDWVDATNWYRVTTFGRLAERLSEQLGSGRLAKGTRIIVFGRLEASAYLDRSNQPQPSLDVVADDVLFADNRPRAEGGEFGAGGSEFDSAPAQPRPAPARRAPPPADDAADLEDLPF
ncbi:MAG TPA: single-stranded DNA-binding protein [Chloroflexota bacterium]|jgi:single-strand DNA-binding protein|nr:single-stranded DNA-binding protein [Chloroflexota bacterium]